MHIMEGFLPWQWCLLWYLLAVPVVAYGVLQIKQITDKNPESKPLLAVSGAFIFVLSSLKLPSVTGSSSHPTGSGLSAILFGPAVTCVLASIVLVFQALLLAHGGITTLGANIFSMGIVGPLAAWIIYKTIIKTGVSSSIAVFLLHLQQMCSHMQPLHHSFHLPFQYPALVPLFSSLCWCLPTPRYPSHWQRRY